MRLLYVSLAAQSSPFVSCVMGKLVIAFCGHRPLVLIGGPVNKMLILVLLSFIFLWQPIMEKNGSSGVSYLLAFLVRHYNVIHYVIFLSAFVVQRTSHCLLTVQNWPGEGNKKSILWNILAASILCFLFKFLQLIVFRELELQFQLLFFFYFELQ